jgi:hypothetical protein
LFSFTSVQHHTSVRQLGLGSYGLCLSSAADSDRRFQRHLLLLHSLKIGNTMNFINCILDLIDIEDLNEENISEAIKTEARSMAGLDPEEFCND